MAGLDPPNLSTKHLRAVVVLARFGSFVAAASYLRMSQPGLSRVVQQAESLLRVKLFARGTRSVSPTEAGREFIPVAERLLGELLAQSQKLRNLDGQLRGQIIISSLMSISHHVLPAALVEFRKLHPKIHIQVREGLTSAVQEDVRSGVADFGVGNAIGLNEAIIAEWVTPEPCYVVLPKSHPLRRAGSLNIRDLAGEPMISMPTDAGLRRTIDVFANERGVVLDHSIITNQFRSLFDFVASGLGVAIVPAAALPPADEYPIAVKPLRPAITRRIGILRLAERSLSPASEAFLKIFQPKFFAAATHRRKR
ncbi:MAG TPA: LysR family transcriptional regulator [Xanthobacteraceae bacterium]|nr:LysR family transcriptional regulator [Xanthobacteraceae bacterium]